MNIRGFNVMHKFKYYWITVSLLLLSLVAFGYTSKQQANTNQKIKVTTTTDFYGEVAKAVLGNRGQVKSIINQPNIDPHDFEPTTQTGKTVAATNIAIANGLGYDDWMTKLVKNGQKITYIRVGNDLMHQKNGANPHIWYNPAAMPKLAKALAKEYGQLQPKHKHYFEQNAKRYISSLTPINDEIAKIKKNADHLSHKSVYVSEPVFDNALTATGFTVQNPAFEKAIENNLDPSPQTIQKMQNGIKNHEIAFFVYNQQVDSKTVNNLVKLAQANHIPVLPVTETLPKGKTYKTWMLEQYQQLNKIIMQ